MTSGVTRLETPEEKELARLKAELSALVAELGEYELDLATLTFALGAFEREYIRRVGSKYAELDEIEAQIAEANAASATATDDARQAASAARTQANKSKEEVNEAKPKSGEKEFAPSARLKAMYRLLASKAHPDLAENEEERRSRTEFLKAVNVAYQEQDLERLQELTHEWELRPEAITGDDIGAQLVRLIRNLDLTRIRIAATLREIDGIKASEINTLYLKAKELKLEKRDLLAELALDLEQKIRNLRLDKHMAQEL